MKRFSSGQEMLPLDDMIKGFVRNLHAAIEHMDLKCISELVAPDVFVFGAAAEAVSIGRDQFITDLESYFERLKEAKLRLHSPEIRVGLCESGRSAWFLDRFIIDRVDDRKITHSFPIRLTGLLYETRIASWQLAAACWSIPLRSNEYQYLLIKEGEIQEGKALDDNVAPETQPLAQSLLKAMAQPHTLPDLYSTREDAFTIGSTVDEVLFAADGRGFVQQIVRLPLKFAVRGGIHTAGSPDGRTAWMATHIDLSNSLTIPYRFFFVWLHTQGEWKIVVSHDAVSIDPFNPGFVAP